MVIGLNKPAFSCIGFEPKKAGINPNCGNCKNYNGVTCHVRAELDELYAESPRFKATDYMMRQNRGVYLK